VADGPVRAADWPKVTALLLMPSWAWLASAESANAATMKVLASQAGVILILSVCVMSAACNVFYLRTI